MKNMKRIVNIKLSADRRNDANFKVDTKQEATRTNDISRRPCFWYGFALAYHIAKRTIRPRLISNVSNRETPE